jgi:hypothetical protein
MGLNNSKARTVTIVSQGFISRIILLFLGPF